MESADILEEHVCCSYKQIIAYQRAAVFQPPPPPHHPPPGAQVLGGGGSGRGGGGGRSQSHQRNPWPTPTPRPSESEEWGGGGRQPGFPEPVAGFQSPETPPEVAVGESVAIRQPRGAVIPLHSDIGPSGPEFWETDFPPLGIAYFGLRKFLQNNFSKFLCIKF